MTGLARPNTPSLGLLVLFALGEGACMTYRLPSNRRTPQKLDRLAPTDTPVVTLVDLSPESEAYRTSSFAFPATRPETDEELLMQGTLRLPHGPKAGLVVVLPILGGDYGASELFAQYLSERGFTTLRFDRKPNVFDPTQDFAHVAKKMELGVIDVRRGIRWGVAEGWDGGHGVGVVGLSMGAFVGTLVSATDPHVEAAVLALSGADLPKVLRHARTEEEIGALYQALEASGWSDERIDRAASDELARVEPLLYASHLDPSRTLLFHARFDRVVPYEYGTQLWEAAGRPARVTLLSGHYSAVLYLPYLLEATTTFMTAALGRGRGTPSW